MKRHEFVLVVILSVVFILLVLVNTVFAQEAQRPTVDHTVHISAEEGKDTEMMVAAPGPGENLTVIVEVPMRMRKVAPPVVTRVTNISLANPPHTHKSGCLYLRGGLGVGAIYGNLTTNVVSMAGLVGGIGYTDDSPWRLRGRFNVGKCRADTVAIGGSLAAMRRLRGNFWVGAGADLFYCTDTSSHPKEQSAKRFVGGSVRMAYERGHFLFEEWIGVVRVTFPIPGGRANHPAVIGGFSASYLF